MLQTASFIPIGRPLEALRIEIEAGEPPEPDAGMLARWGEATASNPRLFNGPILRFMSFDAAAGVIRAKRDSYLRYAMQRFDPASASPERDVYHLAVTGVVLTPDARGRECVMLGRRGVSTFVYPGMWELAPGGGLESADIGDQLAREMEEELGLPPGRALPPEPDAVLGLSIDPNTPSVDVVVRVRLGAGAAGEATHDWEYQTARAVPREDLPSFVAREGEAGIIPPTLAILRGLDWI